jgi:hypothetical protein
VSPLFPASLSVEGFRVNDALLTKPRAWRRLILPSESAGLSVSRRVSGPWKIAFSGPQFLLARDPESAGVSSRRFGYDTCSYSEIQGISFHA